MCEPSASHPCVSVGWRVTLRQLWYARLPTLPAARVRKGSLKYNSQPNGARTMALPAASEVRLAAYGLTDPMDGERRKIWALLDPEFDAVMKDHIARVSEYAPTCAENFRKNHANLLGT